MSVDFGLIGSRIKAERKSEGKTQEWLAEKLDVSVGYISQVERGITKISLETLAEICDILGSDIAFLVSGSAKSQSGYLQNEFSEKFSTLSERDKYLILELMNSMNKK